MFQDAMMRLVDAELEELLSIVNSAYEGSPFEVKMTVALMHPLSFYPSAFYIELTDQRTFPPRRMAIVRKEKDIVFLDWTSETIIALNKKMSLKLTEKNLSDYVRFFFENTRGEKGQYTLVESVDDIPWHDDPPLGARRSLAKLIEPLHILERPADKSWLLSACFLYKSALFKTEIALKKDGSLDLKRQALLAEEMPVLDAVL
jgi:hypothetical protein